MARNIPPEPPYRWRPLGTVRADLPEPGQVIAWRHAAWLVIEVNRAPEADWPDGVRQRMEIVKPEYRDRLIPRHVIVRPAAFKSNGDPVRDANVTVSLSAYGGFRPWDVYPSGHYPVCAECGEPPPCRAEMARELGERAEKDAARFEISGVCPSCQEIPTARHKVITFDVNLRVPLGPPVTFHIGRRECRYDAVKYEQELGKAQPGYRLLLSCPGTVTRHSCDPYDQHGPAECTEGDACRGAKVPHAAKIGCPDSCGRCRDIREGRAASVAERNAAGDWTVW